MRPTSGLTFGGRYQLSSRIAIGGMGEVWQATDLVIGRTVAIKILKDEYLGDPGFLERFRAEARHAALVNHEGIANVFDYGEEDGSAYLVMELVPGEALSAILERERVLSTDRVLDIVAQTASALQAAHAAGLVHRDIKPGNLLITPDGRVKITDFGIARIADQVPLTATGQVMGTVQYLSPEQASGHPASPTTDIYSLGIVAYEALAGRRPFTGESQVAIAMAQINEQPPELPVTVSEPVRNLVDACIAKKPEDRPASAAHLARAAQALRRGDVAGAIAAVPAVAGANPFAAYVNPNAATQATRLLPAGAAVAMTPTQPTPATKKRNPWTWPLVAIVSVLAVALIAILIVLAIKPTSNPTAPTSSTSNQTPSSTPTPSVTTSAPPGSVTINLADYKGLTDPQVRAKLEALNFDLQVSVKTGAAAPNPEDAGKVYAIDPTGNVKRGSNVTATIYGDFPTPGAPSAASTTTAGPYVAGQNLPIQFSSYTGCPSAHPLVGYMFHFTNGTNFASGSGPNPVSKTATSIDLKLGAAGETKVTYEATCSDGISSATSAPFTITVN